MSVRSEARETGKMYLGLAEECVGKEDVDRAVMYAGLANGFLLVGLLEDDTEVLEVGHRPPVAPCDDPAPHTEHRWHQFKEGFGADRWCEGVKLPLAVLAYVENEFNWLLLYVGRSVQLFADDPRDSSPSVTGYLEHIQRFDTFVLCRVAISRLDLVECVGSRPTGDGVRAMSSTQEVQYRVVCVADENLPQKTASLAEAVLQAKARDRFVECGPHRVQKRCIGYTAWETIDPDSDTATQPSDAAHTSCTAILQELRDTLPVGHQELPGLIRAIEVLRHAD